MLCHYNPVRLQKQFFMKTKSVCLIETILQMTIPDFAGYANKERYNSFALAARKQRAN